MKETAIDELRTLNTPPDIIHLNIGMQGKLYTYHLEQPKKKRKSKPKKQPPTLTPPKKESLMDKAKKLVK